MHFAYVNFFTHHPVREVPFFSPFTEEEIARLSNLPEVRGDYLVEDGLETGRPKVESCCNHFSRLTLHK